MNQNRCTSGRIDVLALPEDRIPPTGRARRRGGIRPTPTYARSIDEEYDETPYAREHIVEPVCAGDEIEVNVSEAVWKVSEKYLNDSIPLKVADWTSLRRFGEEADSCLGRQGSVRSGDHSLVSSLPAEALDLPITVQAKPIRQSGHSDTDESDEQKERNDGNVKRITRRQKRQNLLQVEQALTVASTREGDERDLFLGQEDQVTTQMKLRDILIDGAYDADSLRLCVAQENIYSREGTGKAATISETGRVTIQGGSSSNTSAPLAALLPWIRAPSFLLPQTPDIVIEEINFWMCPDVCRTNTHYDGHHNYLLVLRGTKTVELSPPGAIRASPVHSNHANHPILLRCTDVGGHLINNTFHSDIIKCECATRSNIVVSVSAGEAILIPEGWWHRVESSAGCMAVNIWFNHKHSSISGFAHDENQHALPYHAREMVRRYVDANIEDAAKSRLHCAFPELLNHLGMDYGGWREDPGQAIKQFVLEVHLGRLIPTERTDEEILIGLRLIECHAAQLLGVSHALKSADSNSVPSLRRRVLPHAADILGRIISLFITVLDADKERDRRAMLSLFDSFPSVRTSHQREVFTALVTSLTREACVILSQAWEKHEPPAEAEASYNNLFGCCIGDEGRAFFLREIDAFRDDCANKLILGDLMLLNLEE